MRTLLLLPLLGLPVLLLPVAPSGADTGAWENRYSLAEGPLYAVGDNPDVALDQELLVLDDYTSGQVTALFQFRNTSDHAVTVEAGFPVVLDLQTEEACEKDGVVAYEEGCTRKVWLLSLDYYRRGVDAGLLALAGLKAHAGKTIEFGDPAPYFRPGELARRRVETKMPKKTPFAFSIEQDGQPVALTSLVVEIIPPEKAQITYHFRHRLVFGPHSTSTVRVRYKAPTLSGGSDSLAPTHYAHFTWRYVLSTGATWKGPLGKLVLAVPRDGVCANEEAWRTLGVWGGYRILERSAFEPVAADDIVCDWRRGDESLNQWAEYWSQEWDGPPTPWANAKHLPPDVRGIGASSQRPAQADVYAERGVILGAPSTAEAAFDGILETAWSEATKTDVGEYLEFELTRPATGLRVMGGFLGALHEFAGTDTAGKKRAALYKNLYAWNARPTRLELVSVDGARRWTLPVQDQKAVWNVYPLLIPTGTYRLVIQASAKGKKWQDTSIAEVDFVTGETAWLEALRKDAFYAPFFADGVAYLQPWASTPDRR